MVAELIINKWEIVCNHTPETIDKIMMNFRKRGMSLNSFQYNKTDEFKAVCILEFEESQLGASQIFSNIQRIYDIIEVKDLS